MVNQVDYETVNKTCLFDLCVLNIENIIDCLNTNVKDFCNPVYLHLGVDSNKSSKIRVVFN
jgi:hypothetical protein